MRLRKNNIKGLLLLILLYSVPAYSSDIVVNIFKPLVPRGEIYVDLHTSQSSCDQFDDKSVETFSAYASKVIPVTNEKMSVVFKDVPMGIYAVSAFHDLNGDRILNRQVFPGSGVPLESYGTSNNYFSPFSKPMFEKSSFAVHTDQVEITINLRHNRSATNIQKP